MAGIKISQLPSAALPLTGAEITPIVQSGDTVQVALNNMFSASTGSSQVGFIASGTSATLRTVQSKLRDSVSVKDFGAVGDGVTDDTAAFTAANAANKSLFAPAGTYKLTNWQPTDGTVLRGAGYLATYITQGANGSPAIFINNGNVNWQGLEFSGFTLNGSASPTVAAFQITPGASGAVWRCKFDFCAQNTYQAFNVTSIGTNFFDNDVHIQSEGTTTTAVYQQSGTYNRYNLFLTNCANSIALDHGGVNDTIYVVADGQIKDSGLNTTFINPTVEFIYGPSLPVGEAVISMTGTNQVLLNPTVILPSGSAAKCSYAFQPSNLTTFVNPYVTSSGTILANPFSVNSGFSWTLIGGQSNCTNKIETIYNDSTNVYSLRFVTMVGDVSQFTSQTTTHGGGVPQYAIPVNGGAVTINGNTDTLMLEPAAGLGSQTFYVVNGIVNGRKIAISSTQAITTITWVMGSGGTTNLPTTIAANSSFTIAYNSAQNKWYRA